MHEKQSDTIKVNDLLLLLQKAEPLSNLKQRFRSDLNVLRFEIPSKICQDVVVFR